MGLAGVVAGATPSVRQGLVWSVYTQAPGLVGEPSLQGPNCTLGILVLLIFKLD